MYIIVHKLSATTGLLVEGVSALLADGSFKLRSTPAMHALKAGEFVFKSIQEHPAEAASFEERLKTSLSSCLQSRSSSQRVRREKMWSSYHTLRTSEHYLTEWRLFLQKCGISEVSPIFCQYVGHHVFKQLTSCTIHLNHLNPTAQLLVWQHCRIRRRTLSDMQPDMCQEH